MKSFVMDISKPGAPTFIDNIDRADYQKALSYLRRTGHTKVRFTLEVYIDKMTNEKQSNLWQAILTLVVMESGNDRKTVSETLLSNFNKDPKDMSNEEFNSCLESSFVTIQEIFGVELYLSKAGKVERKIE